MHVFQTTPSLPTHIPSLPSHIPSPTYFLSLLPPSPSSINISKNVSNNPLHSSSPQHPSHNNNNSNHSNKGSQTKKWNSKIKHHLNKGHYDKTISLYDQMLEQNALPNAITFSLLLKVCSSSTDLKTARLLHNDIIRHNLTSSHFVAAALLDCYTKCGRPDLAHQVFDKMSQPDVVAYTTIFRQSSRNGQFESAIQIFRQMVAAGISPDSVSLVTILSSIASAGHLKLGAEIHGYLTRRGIEFNKFLISSLVNMYAKLGKLDSAGKIFDLMSCGDNVESWTAMIAGQARSGDSAGAIKMFEKLVSSGIEPSRKTLSSVLRAVSQLGSLQLGLQIHGYMIRKEFTLDEFVISGLIDMYDSCGASSSYCHQLFDKMPVRDVVSWTTMIGALGRRGEATAALRMFHDMRAAGITPDSVTFTVILRTCSVSGMLRDGLGILNSMIREFQIRPREEHYACLVDLFARNGELEEAYSVIEDMEFRDGGVWEAFLRACKAHGNVDLGELAAQKLREIEPDNTSSYILLSDIYSATGR